MKRVLFVSNGHGEAAIADRIAAELQSIAPDLQRDHLALVGDPAADAMRAVGPRRTMPSGGLIAMGNLVNLARDLRAGLAGLTLAQAAFLRKARGSYAVAIAVGDVYALSMALLARARTIFVGTAKSVAVAKYGPIEERMLARAAAAFVRDDATASALARHGLNAQAANVIVDLVTTSGDAEVARAFIGFDPRLVLLPGSRANADEDAALLLGVSRELARNWPTLGAVLSIARGLKAEAFAARARETGWSVRASDDDAIPFCGELDGRIALRAWSGTLAPLLPQATLVLGQAGTANEAAAAAGIPVVAFRRGNERKAAWYRRRQQSLLGEALAVFSSDLPEASAAVDGILRDPVRRDRMSKAGRERMGAPGGARRIAQCAAALAGSD